MVELDASDILPQCILIMVGGIPQRQLASDMLHRAVGRSGRSFLVPERMPCAFLRSVHGGHVAQAARYDFALIIVDEKP